MAYRQEYIYMMKAALAGRIGQSRQRRLIFGIVHGRNVS